MHPMNRSIVDSIVILNIIRRTGIDGSVCLFRPFRGKALSVHLQSELSEVYVARLYNSSHIQAWVGDSKDMDGTQSTRFQSESTYKMRVEENRLVRFLPNESHQQ